LSLLRDLIEERTGIHYADRQIEILADRVRNRMAELGQLSFLDYYYLLKYDEGADAEWPLLHSCVTVNETYFWREAEILELVISRLIPERRAFTKGPVRVWHAGCSTGEEPYSLAMGLQESGEFMRTAVEIKASDLDVQALETAQRAVYRERSLRYLPENLKEKYFNPLPGAHFALQREIRDRVHFARENLLEVSPPPESLDIIFCRNVLIYFRDAMVVKVLQTLQKALREGGYLMMGASESLLRFQTDFQLVEKGGLLTYCKESKRGT
ncbi:unnamed protein product, partial [Phaeothamnion confervicola]